MSYNENLWEEIPPFAFMILGRRGREQISLYQCFTPFCQCQEQNELHPIEKIQVIIPKSPSILEKELLRYKIYCDQCQKSFNLTFERQYQSLPSEYKKKPNISIERVYATDENNEENYGEIGYIQHK